MSFDGIPLHRAERERQYATSLHREKGNLVDGRGLVLSDNEVLNLIGDEIYNETYVGAKKQCKAGRTLIWSGAAGMLAGAKSSSTSVFKNVEFIRVRRKRNTIHVDQLLDKNQVYAEDADFDFVEKFIKEHCVKAKIC